ncbi:MAG: PEP-CTERM sorting domain-containing protein [Candidatus Competibacteraceae bacterium]
MRFNYLKSLVLITGTTTLFLGGMSAASAYTIYTDRAAWEAALSGSTIITDTFSNTIPSAQSITLDSGIVSTNSSPPALPNSFNNNSVNIVTPGAYDNAVGGTTASATITWVFPSDVFAFGADFISANLDRLTLTGNFDGTGDQSILVNNTIGGPDGFLGVIGTAKFSSIVFSSANSVLDSFAIDNASFAVPEPGTIALVLVGGLGLLSSRRVKRS